MKKIILYVLIILWMCLIFFFSNQPANNSTNMSDGLMSKIINIVQKVTNHEFSDSQLDNIYEYGVGPLRKCAHFSIFLILGILIYNLIKEYNINSKNVFIISLLFCILYACSDEIHQLFVLGRSGNVKDVLIDTFGSFFGILITSKVIRCIKNN